ncbi:MAG: glycosyltransferase family 4 protein [Chloroflexota bacterium]
MTHLRVAINAHLFPGGGLGGVEQFVMGLVRSLGQLQDRDEEYLIVTPAGCPDWIAPYLGPNQQIVSPPTPGPGRIERARQRLGPVGHLASAAWPRLRRSLVSLTERPEVPDSNGFYESLRVDAVHFPYQQFARSTLPSIYNPHDLQHLHYPQFFSKRQLSWRETAYRAGCAEAHAVVAESGWVKQDIACRCGVPRERLFSFPMGAPTALYEPVGEQTAREVSARLQLPESFALYPAQTWPHKNHLRLLEAIAIARDEHRVSVPLVCTGVKNGYWPRIEERIAQLALRDSVHFLGYVTPAELRALYRLARFLVLPSLFEGGGFPVLEGFSEGTPVACANVTSLPEYGGDAVLLFDPASAESIAAALVRMATDPDLRDSLRRRGSERIRVFDWSVTARSYRALYRKVAGRPLSDEDLSLLSDRPIGAPVAGREATRTGASER